MVEKGGGSGEKAKRPASSSSGGSKAPKVGGSSGPGGEEEEVVVTQGAGGGWPGGEGEAPEWAPLPACRAPLVSLREPIDLKDPEVQPPPPLVLTCSRLFSDAL